MTSDKKIIEVNVIELSELLKWSWGITNEKNNVFNHFESYSNFYYIDSIIKIFKSNPIILILFEFKNDFIFVIYIIISKSMFVCLTAYRLLRPVSLEPVRPKVESRGKNFPEKWSVAKLPKMCATYIQYIAVLWTDTLSSYTNNSDFQIPILRHKM